MFSSCLHNNVDNSSHFDTNSHGFHCVKDISKAAEPRTELGYSAVQVSSSLAVCWLVVDNHRFQTVLDPGPFQSQGDSKM